MRGRVLVLARRGAALIANGRLDDLLLEPPEGDPRPVPGEIHRATLDRVVPKMGSAFVRLAGGETGFLREAKGHRQGDEILAQVVSCAEPGKAAPVTSRVLFKGRRAILTPGAPGVNVSRRIREAEERDRLAGVGTAALADAGTGEGCGLILRSAAEEAGEAGLAAEIRALAAARRAALDATGPGPVWRDPAWRLALREWTERLPDRILLDTDLAGRLLSLRGKAADPRESHGALLDEALAARVEAHDGPDPFEDLGIWEEVEHLGDPRVPLASGGWLMVEPTTALVAVDVNTGGDFSPAAGLKANLDAAREIPRQLRLRGLGGQVVIDLAPMGKKDRKRFEEALKGALKRDPVETSAVGWTGLGLFELQRKRERRALSELV